MVLILWLESFVVHATVTRRCLHIEQHIDSRLQRIILGLETVEVTKVTD